MREGRTIDLMRRMHRLPAEGCRRILHEGDVVAELHPKTAGRYDAGIRQHTDDDDLLDPVLLQLVVEVGVGKATLRPTLFNDNVALPRLEIRMKFTAPGALGKSLALT